MMMNFLFSSVISFILIYLNSTISKKKYNEREKYSPFECGFDPKSSARLPFSLRFYLIAVIFLIFDVEITLLLPLPIIMNYTNTIFSEMMGLLFFLILISGLFHEWNQGALEWDY